MPTPGDPHETRFDYMTPAQLRARRDRCNLAFLPVGTLEWHGSTQPFGTDNLIPHHLAQIVAGRFGGVVFPPITYGDTRYIVQEKRVEWRKTAAQELGVPEAFLAAFSLQANDGTPGYDCPTQPDDGQPPEVALPFTLHEQNLAFDKHIAGVLLQAHLYGFKRVVMLPGHGPNPKRCEAAAKAYRDNAARRGSLGQPMETLTWFMWGQDEPSRPAFWTHACSREASMTMVAAPGSVDLSQLSPDTSKPSTAYLGAPYLNEDDGYLPGYADRRKDFEALDPRHANEALGHVMFERFARLLEAALRRWAPDLSA